MDYILVQRVRCKVRILPCNDDYWQMLSPAMQLIWSLAHTSFFTLDMN